MRPAAAQPDVEQHVRQHAGQPVGPAQHLAGDGGEDIKSDGDAATDQNEFIEYENDEGQATVLGSGEKDDQAMQDIGEQAENRSGGRTRRKRQLFWHS